MLLLVVKVYSSQKQFFPSEKFFMEGSWFVPFFSALESPNIGSHTSGRKAWGDKAAEVLSNSQSCLSLGLRASPFPYCHTCLLWLMPWVQLETPEVLCLRSWPVFSSHFQGWLPNRSECKNHLGCLTNAYSWAHCRKSWFNKKYPRWFQYQWSWEPHPEKHGQ